jgi:hypothetical protein
MEETADPVGPCAGSCTFPADWENPCAEKRETENGWKYYSGEYFTAEKYKDKSNYV